MAGKKSTKRQIRKPSENHGLSKIREYRIWSGMITRCTNPKRQKYGDYGGRGISVCDRWRQSFVAFIEDMGRCPPGYTIERNDTNGNYEPGNCRWASWQEQHLNRRNSRLLSFEGVTKTLSEWAEILGISQSGLHTRISRGHSIDEALRRPLGKGKMITFNGKTQNIQRWTKELGFRDGVLSMRLQNGWSIEKALSVPARRNKCKSD